jgi:hypothetical protein
VSLASLLLVQSSLFRAIHAFGINATPAQSKIATFAAVAGITALSWGMTAARIKDSTWRCRLQLWVLEAWACV